MPLKSRRVERVPLAPDRVALGRVRRVLLHEEAPERRVRLGGARRRAARRRRRERGRRRGPTASYSSTSAWKNGGSPTPSSTPAPHVGLLRARDRLPAGGDDALRRALGEARPRCRQALGDERHAAPRSTCQSSAVSRGMRSNAMRTYCTGTAEHAQVAEALAGVVLLERELEPLAHHLGGDAVGVGLRASSGVERAQRGPVVLGPLVARRRASSRSSRGRGRRCPRRSRRAGRARRSARRSGRRGRTRASSSASVISVSALRGRTVRQGWPRRRATLGQGCGHVDALDHREHDLRGVRAGERRPGLHRPVVGDARRTPTTGGCRPAAAPSMRTLEPSRNACANG